MEVIENEHLLNNAKENGDYLMQQLKNIESIQNVRGRGFMIGFDVPEELKELKKKLLFDFKIFTGEAKPNVIRLLPSLALNRRQIDDFLDALNEAIDELKS